MPQDLWAEHGETTRLTVAANVKMQADHLQQHVRRILAIREARGGA